MITSRDVLIYYSLICDGDWSKTFAFVRGKSSLPGFEAIEEAVKPYRNNTLTLIDENYPAWMRDLIHPPLVIYYRGNIKLLANRDYILTITGSIETDNSYAFKQTEEIASKVTEHGVAVMSGLSRGTQQKAIEAALSKGPAIVVLGSGIKNSYPKEAAPLQEKACKKGLVLSFFPDNCFASADKMRERNAFLGQACRLLFFPNLRYNDGNALILRVALSCGIDVGCLPYPAGSDYANNDLIYTGAALVEGYEDILFEMGLSKKWTGAE